MRTLDLICLLLFPDVFENKQKGLFKLLDNCGKLKCKDVGILVQNASTSWENSSRFIVSKSQDFVIRHFTGDVIYKTVSITYHI